MTSAVWLNVPLAVLVILAIVGIPLWMTFRRPDQHPDYAEARTHFETKAARARGQAVTVRGHVLAGPERPVRRLTVAGRRRSGGPVTVRSHAPATRRSTRASA
jgi:hypothetical protein